MVKTLKIGEKQVQFSTSFAWAFAYKAQFKKDPIKLLIPAVKKATGDEEDSEEDDSDLTYALLEELGFTGIVEMAWAMAKICDSTLPDPVTWVISLGDDFSVMTFIEELLSEALLSCFTSKNSLAPEQVTQAPEKVKRVKK